MGWTNPVQNAILLPPLSDINLLLDTALVQIQKYFSGKRGNSFQRAQLLNVWSHRAVLPKLWEYRNLLEGLGKMQMLIQEAGWGLRPCSSNKLPGDADAAGLWTIQCSKVVECLKLEATLEMNLNPILLPIRHLEPWVVVWLPQGHTAG